MTDKPNLIEAMIAGTKEPVIFNAACIVDMKPLGPGKPHTEPATRWQVRYAVGDGTVVTVETNRWSLNPAFERQVEIG